jgi:hypothetical protein
MIKFTEIPKSEIYTTYNTHYRDDARYFQIYKENKPLCIYGVLSRGEGVGEAFWVLNSFNKNVLTKKFFENLFNHLFSLDFKEIYTWTRCKKLTNVFCHYNKFGIEKIDFPYWDKDETKTWFLKRI